MAKIFNVSADCKPKLHYMVDLTGRLEQIKAMVDAGEYFTVNRARQYGKTTTLRALERFLKNDYITVSLDFQMISYADFEKEETFAAAFSTGVLDALEGQEGMPEEIRLELEAFADGQAAGVTLSRLFRCLNRWCRQSEKKIVLMIDEADSASNNQVFLDFLAQLRGSYINRDKKKTFQSVILAGVYDVKNLKRKITADHTQRRNSPWNIASDFTVDMSFSVRDIEGMLSDYETDHGTGMQMGNMAEWIYTYTGGYPFLVSRLCKLIDEQVAGSGGFPDKGSAWSRDGLLEAVRILLSEKNTLFESLTEKLDAYPELRGMIEALLFQGKSIAYNPDDTAMEMALMFGFMKTDGSVASIANRIFEMRLYNMFLTVPQIQESRLYNMAEENRNQFVANGHLNMHLVLEKFVRHFDDLYGDQNDLFYEDDGRRYFLLYLRPIINGTGNYYIEAETRNRERTDVIIDYRGEQIVVELKVWHGNAYHTRGEKQLLDYLDHYHLDRGYMISFNFNKNKDIGVQEIRIGNKVLIEAIV